MAIHMNKKKWYGKCYTSHTTSAALDMYTHNEKNLLCQHWIHIQPHCSTLPLTSTILQNLSQFVAE